MSIPKHYVIKNDRLEEVRGYKDEVVVERWGIVYNEDDIPVGLRPLPVEEVIPESILDKIKFWRKPKPLTQILSIDFIGLIQYIGLINKIKKIVTIEQILEILNIKKVDVIEEITTIRDLTWSPRNLIQNPSFEQGFAGWFKQPSETHKPVLDDTVKAHVGKYSVKFPKETASWIDQTCPIAIDPSWFTAFKFWLRADYVGNVVRFYYYDVDGNYFEELFGVTESSKWELKTITPPSKAFWGFGFFHYDVENNNCWIDNIFVVF